MKYIFRFLFLMIALVIGSVSVSAKNTVTPEATLSFFQSVIPITVSPSIPTVFEMPITDPAFRDRDFALYEETTQTFQPAFYREKRTPLQFSLQSDSAIGAGSLSALTDGLDTFVEFPVSLSTEENSVTIDFRSEQLSTLSGIVLIREPYGALPKTVEISRVDADGTPQIVLARTNVSDQTIRFLKTTSDHFRISLGYNQPLRLQEISFFNEEMLNLEERSIRFLARPGEKYALYFRADRPFFLSFREEPNLISDKDIQKVAQGTVIVNTLYLPADMDGDSVIDERDNCINDANTDQRDENTNGRGDVCDDYDRDSVINSEDNCPSHPNLNQRDTDNDGKGDVCDGEESRVTERYAWLPWLVMGIGVLVVGGLFVATIRGKK
ncbi:MAG: thrombospondin type 3 repeat-containing protein [Candidatus Moranbacteria bacterium]|nr:thrombospondin type 3 repeat-containing protein [Candidatus Moranbacteria bacterium]MDD3964584.1 thrombospondin type 3 repeat-containing protein [Candidatus Moranbacteria bacterium]